jgi:hypothetical protein
MLPSVRKIGWDLMTGMTAPPGGRLEDAGFHDVIVETNPERLRFRARR